MTNFTNFVRLFVTLAALCLFACGGCEPDPQTDAGGLAPDMGEGDAVATIEPDTSVPDAGTPRDMNRTRPDVWTADIGRPDMNPADMGPIVLRLDAVIPPRGPVGGGTPIVVTGSGFTEESVVYFGSRTAEVELIDGDLVGQAPAGQGPGAVTVKILDPTYGEELLAGGYEYVAELGVDSVSPRRVPTTGGVEVTVRGRGFDADTRVSFGGLTGVRHELIDPTLMRVIVPAHAAGVFDVRVTNRDATTTLAEGIEFFDGLELDSIRPAGGPASGGTTVTLTGTGFDPSLSVEFGNVAANVQSVAPTGDSATVVTPAHPSGLVDVRLENGAGDAHLALGAFYYSTGPGDFTIASVSPTQGVEAGGTEVLIIGAGLDSPSLNVRFDGVVATIVDKGPGHVVVQTPPHATGPVDVAVSNGSDTDTLVNGFEYVANLWIDRVTPDTGDVAGGYPVVIEGEGFASVTAVEFGGIPSSFNVDSATQITAQAPAHSAGLVDVVVERDEVSARFRDAFTFTEPLEIYGLRPVRGSVAGNTYVEIFGRGLIGTSSVTFDQTASPQVDVLDAQTLAVRTPAHAPGITDVEVTAGGSTVASPFPYTYFNPGSRFGGAWGGPVQGAVNVTVYSTDGQPLENAFVMLSTTPLTPYQGFTDPNGMVTLSGPEVFGEQTVTATYQLFVEARPCNPEIKWTSSATVQRVDAENITIFLSLDPPPPLGGTPPPEAGCEEGTYECYCRAGNPACDDPNQCNPFTGVCCPPPPEFPEEPFATYTGYLSGLDKLAEPGPSEFQMAIVYTTQTDIFGRNPDPGDGNVVLTNGNYTLRSRIGDLALIAVGGLYNNSTNTFKPLMMGVERYLFAADGQTYTVDLDLNIPLNTALQFKVNNSPRYSGGPTVNEVVPWLDLGFEGVFGGVDLATGNSTIVTAAHQPALTGIFSDASFTAIGGAYNNGGLPLSIGIARNITDTSRVVDIPGLIGIAQVTSPPNGGKPIDGLIEFDLRDPIEPSFYYVDISVPTLTGLKTLWNAFLPPEARSVRLPDFPAFTQLPPSNQPSPYPPGTYVLDVIGIQKPGFQWENFSYNDLGFGDWEAYSYSRSTISF